MTTHRAILHVDMDAFYASVEQRDDPSLRGKPVVVGGHSRRGVVSAASYEAREYGIHSAMPMMTALKRCPHAVVVSGNMQRYAEVSDQVFDVFHRYTPLVEGLSIDEAFLDVTGSQALFGDAISIARRIKEDIYAETGLRASAGVAPSKFVAKVASDLDKPDGLVVVAAESVREFLAPLPIRRMWGVGPKAAERLVALGFETIGDLTEVRAEVLESVLGTWGLRIWHLAHGDDDRAIVTEREAKSIGAEVTFEEDLMDQDAFETAILSQTVRVATRLRRAGLWAHVITVKVKNPRHKSKTRQMRIDPPACDTDTIFATAKALLDRVPGLEEGARLIGVSASDLTEDPPRSLFPDEQREKRERLEALTGELHARFGKQSATRARLLGISRHAPLTQLKSREPRKTGEE